MKKSTIVKLALLLVFVSAAGFAQTPGQSPLPSEALAAILATPAMGGSCATQSAQALFASEGIEAACTATANCGSSSPVSCSGSSSCTTVDSNCSTLQAGYVKCDGVTTWCGPCCPSGSSCCQCSYTGNCYQCCRCAGGTNHQCVDECNA